MCYPKLKQFCVFVMIFTNANLCITVQVIDFLFVTLVLLFEMDSRAFYYDNHVLSKINSCGNFGSLYVL